MMFLFFLSTQRPPRSTRTDTLFPDTTLFRSGIFIFRQSLQSIITGRLSLLEDGGFAAYHRIGTRRDGDAPGLPVGELQRGFTGNVFDGQQHFGGCSSSVCPPMPAHTFDREELWPPSWSGSGRRLPSYLTAIGLGPLLLNGRRSCWGK